MNQKLIEDLASSVERLSIAPFIQRKLAIAIEQGDFRSIAAIMIRVVEHAGYELHKEEAWEV